ncbi:MAG: type II toxin-antitoxin system RelB/DinJ family antitoxin [Candidatus Marinimicrobia bacterium]|nr:type II toxin-antitoxin system RelB/DinJ family antitoxin [Candidatus Neomarinimicrobiota bacterium]
MALQSAKINTRIEPELKEQVDAILDKLGLTMAEAIRLYFKQIVHRKGIPFDVRIPNPETQAAMEDARDEENLISYTTPEEHFKSLGI